MAALTKKQRSEAAKKAAATRARKAAINTRRISAPGVTAVPNAKVDGVEVTKLDQGVGDFSIEQLDGAYAVLRLGKERRLVGQADLVNVSKQVAKAVQVTY